MYWIMKQNYVVNVFVLHTKCSLVVKWGLLSKWNAENTSEFYIHESKVLSSHWVQKVLHNSNDSQRFCTCAYFFLSQISEGTLSFCQSFWHCCSSLGSDFNANWIMRKKQGQKHTLVCRCKVPWTYLMCTLALLWR